jgi:hypothetical protein
MNFVRHSYGDECEILLKDLTGIIEEITVEEKEELIRSGVNYSEFISKEDVPSESMKKIFFSMLKWSKRKIATYVVKISEAIYNEKGKDLVLVSLARAGTPYGILIKRYLKLKYNVDIKHYSISIIRGKGIDYNALKYILKNNQRGNIQFVDGWTGKGSIIGELNSNIDKFNKEFNKNVDSSLAVVADPAKLCKFYGTREDIVIPSCCLNSTVSGLISRTVHNREFIGEMDFHGAKTLDYLRSEDLSMYFIDEISNEFCSELVDNYDDIEGVLREDFEGEEEIAGNKVYGNDDEYAIDNIGIESKVTKSRSKYLNGCESLMEPIEKEYARTIAEEIRQTFNVKSINNIKLSIGESARVLLRRKARLVLVRDLEDKNIAHIIELAKEKGVKVVKYNTGSYRCMAIIEEEIK